MKTKYQTPEMNLLLFVGTDVIVTSYQGSLNPNDEYDFGNSGGSQTSWGDLMS